MKHSIGIDVGGTSLKGALVSPEGGIDATFRIDASQAQAQEGLIRSLAALIRELRAQSPEAPVGIGVAGLVDAPAGLVRQSPNFPLWRDVPVVEGLRAAGVGGPIGIDNDANAAGLAEALYGQAKGVDSFLFFTLGTGVGGAVYLGGALWRGYRGYAGELGHVNVVPGGRQCGCGARGCLEQYASLSGLRQFVGENAADFGDAASLVASVDLPERLGALADTGHLAAQRAWQQVGYYLGIGMGSLLNALDVQQVVLGGGIAEALPQFEAPLREALAQHTFGPIVQDVALRRSTLGPNAGVVGAAALGLTAEVGP